MLLNKISSVIVQNNYCKDGTRLNNLAATKYKVAREKT